MRDLLDLYLVKTSAILYKTSIATKIRKKKRN